MKRLIILASAILMIGCSKEVPMDTNPCGPTTYKYGNVYTTYSANKIIYEEGKVYYCLRKDQRSGHCSQRREVKGKLVRCLY